MNKEQLIALGLTEEQADKIIAGYGAMIPKSRFDEVNTAKVKAEKDVADRDAQITELGKTAGLSEDLKKQIETLTTENKTATEKHATEMKDLQMSNAIKSALTGKVHDEGLAAGLITKDKLVLDGDKVVGLDEQITAIKGTHAFLFKTDGQQQQQGFRVGADGQQQQQQQTTPSLKDAIASHFQTKS